MTAPLRLFAGPAILLGLTVAFYWKLRLTEGLRKMGGEGQFMPDSGNDEESDPTSAFSYRNLHPAFNSQLYNLVLLDAT